MTLKNLIPINQFCASHNIWLMFDSITWLNFLVLNKRITPVFMSFNLTKFQKMEKLKSVPDT